MAWSKNDTTSVIVGYASKNAESSTREPLIYLSDDNGDHWRAISFAKEKGTELSAITCKEKNYCVAIGKHGHISNQPQESDSDKVLAPIIYISSDGGNHWRSPSALAKAPGEPILTSVSCINDKHCSAVGYYEDNTGAQEPLFYSSRDYGDHWILAQGNLPPSSYNKLASVSCMQNGMCNAVGSSGKSWDVMKSLVYRSIDFGIHWSLSENLPASDYKKLNGVTCQNNRCNAVGTYFLKDPYGEEEGHPYYYIPISYVSEDSGLTWHFIELPRQGGYTDDDLSSIMCDVNGRCVAAGHWTFGSDLPWEPLTLISSDFGNSWIGTHPPKIGEDLAHDLNSIACKTDGVCILVGTKGGYGDSEPNIPLTYISTDFGNNWRFSAVLPPLSTSGGISGITFTI